MNCGLPNSIPRLIGLSSAPPRRSISLRPTSGRLLVGRTFEALHDFGVLRGGHFYTHEFRHVVIDIHAPGLTQTDVLEGKASCYIVCFTEARPNHQCRCRVPIVPFDVYPDEKEVGCIETSNILTFLNFLSRPDAIAHQDFQSRLFYKLSNGTPNTPKATPT
ncbi:hypothetical protein B0H14DRAFT_2663372 [Mycena olivaceomarginata]|nr:hypothetical protein B0H14DRAFT_2663372 [Mycena olivaceomarginata]